MVSQFTVLRHWCIWGELPGSHLNWEADFHGWFLGPLPGIKKFSLYFPPSSPLVLLSLIEVTHGKNPSRGLHLCSALTVNFHTQVDVVRKQPGTTSDLFYAPAFEDWQMRIQMASIFTCFLSLVVAVPFLMSLAIDHPVSGNFLPKGLRPAEWGCLHSCKLALVQPQAGILLTWVSLLTVEVAFFSAS